MSVGLIGGADGPTAIFVSSVPPLTLLLCAVGAIVGLSVVLWLAFRR
ncbi:MAG: hypothetical protein ACOX7F_06405 [Eubacteriales bacterium]|jgi:Na+-transporting methylmalonyl-CoA/oxaloacetate decarboxylase beta subunit